MQLPFSEYSDFNFSISKTESHFFFPYNYQSGELAENVSKIVDPQYADSIDMSEVQVEKPSYSLYHCDPRPPPHKFAVFYRMSSQQL